ncbi:membrane dipeptidase [Sphingopyxis panaciterrae]|uniref:dipeptidase n=1 Tax=Sphingopyxis panaciterrae TaxID=363841 RepID=UPI001423AAAF|nr:membrane dipeptidase [Sphingopyxis panaciterrae]NIJ36367.1 membrane dipeptidase [Sphingopyxis panaciterrae]
MNRREALFSSLGLATTLSVSTAFANQPPGRSATLKEARQLQDSTLLVDQLDGSAMTDEYLDMLESAGVDIWQGHGMSSFSNATAMLNFFDKHAKRLVLVKSVRDIRQAHQDGKIGYLVGWQSATYLTNETDEWGLPPIENLRTFWELGLRICGLIYNNTTVFGGGSLDPTLGLSRAGRRLVEQIHKQRIVLDVGGHTGDQTSYDAIAMSKGVPVICSHTNLRAIADNPRNMPDKMIEQIAASGGVVGVTAVNDFHARSRKDEKIRLTPQVGLEKHLDQYDYLKRLVGVDHIGLGCDFMYGRADLTRTNPLLWPPDAYSAVPPAEMFMVKGYEKITELPNVTQGLMQRGWTDDEIRKVLGGNWMRVYEQVWGA